MTGWTRLTRAGCTTIARSAQFPPNVITTAGSRGPYNDDVSLFKT
jgi:hypothetical protein